MNEFQVILEIRRNGILHGTDDLGACCAVGENGEVGVEELIGFADWNRELEPVSGGGDGARVNVVLLQPRIDRIDSLSGGLDEALDLLK